LFLYNYKDKAGLEKQILKSKTDLINDALQRQLNLSFGVFLFFKGGNYLLDLILNPDYWQ
jgi:hypothetical protein